MKTYIRDSRKDANANLSIANCLLPIGHFSPIVTLPIANCLLHIGRLLPIANCPLHIRRLLPIALCLLLILSSCKQKSSELHVQHQEPEQKVTELDINTLLQPSNLFVVSTIAVTTIELSKQPVKVDALGSISYDTRQVGNISATYAGRIEKLYIRYRFQKVYKGQKIMEIYSPELMTAQQNHLFLLRNDAANVSLISASKQRLQLLGMTPSQITNFIKAGKPIFAVPVYSNYTGHIHEATANTMPASPQGAMQDVPTTTEELSLRPGMYIQKGQSLFAVYNPNRVWATLNIYAETHMLVKQGDAVVIVPETAPAKQVRGKINFIEPFFREGSKTLTARVYFNNSTLQLPVGSQVRATINSGFEEAAWLPESAVVSLGSDKVVFKKQQGGFKAHKLVTGLSNNGRIQVVSGLTNKDTVAQNGQYLIDSESFIKVSQ
jgi:Cu(I)/Ag(I) efflux system membrane fusion protein